MPLFGHHNPSVEHKYEKVMKMVEINCFAYGSMLNRKYERKLSVVIHKYI